MEVNCGMQCFAGLDKAASLPPAVMDPQEPHRTPCATSGSSFSYTDQSGAFSHMPAAYALLVALPVNESCERVSFAKQFIWGRINASF